MPFKLTLTSTDSKLYDRQIRIFGKDTQEKLISTSIQLITPALLQEGSESLYIAGEILKNFILLGVTQIYATDECISALKLLVPDEFMTDKRINITREYLNTNINIFIDSYSDDSGIFICTQCYRFGDKWVHECTKECSGNDVALECLLGAVFVQEMVKKLMGVDYRSEYKLVL